VLVEESVLGWEELELEVVRDAKNQMITVCFIENVDAMGVHTGDSLLHGAHADHRAGPAGKIAGYAYAIVEAIEVIGGTNVQFAHDPQSGRVVVIEINPRTSRSSALASKATGFPIARVSALLAGGLTLDEMPYWRDGTLEKYTPSGDYVVVKFARWAFEKFAGIEDRLGTQMRAVGEVMSIGKTYKEALQKAIRSLEINRYGLGFAKNFNKLSLETLLRRLAVPTSERFFLMYEALRKGAGIEQLHAITHIKPWFIEQMQELVALEERIIACKGGTLPDDLLVAAKKDGFADRYLAKLLGLPEKAIRERRTAWAWSRPGKRCRSAGWTAPPTTIPPTMPPTRSPSAIAENHGAGRRPQPHRSGDRVRLLLRACGPGHPRGRAESIMVNCNPETVSTDYDTSDKLYFEPLTVEDVLSIYQKENPKGSSCNSAARPR
jgi:carbamoyl-phosphate synthase large subunit